MHILPEKQKQLTVNLTGRLERVRDLQSHPICPAHTEGTAPALPGKVNFMNFTICVTLPDALAAADWTERATVPRADAEVGAAQ